MIESAKHTFDVLKEKGVKTELLFGKNMVHTESTWAFGFKKYSKAADTLAKVASFDNFTVSEEAYNNYVNNGKDAEFKMFDLNLSTYSKDIKEFAENYITAYDEDGNHVLDENEFMKMATQGAENVNDETKASSY